MDGCLYGVGIGPGDPELMTLKAVRLIAECDVVAVPETRGEKTVALDIARQVVPSLDEKEQVRLFMPMTRDLVQAKQSRDAAAAQVEEQLRQGKNVVFLTLGDPTIYSTYLYVHRRVTAAGCRAELVPGVPSFCAVAAKLGMGLVEGDEALIVLPASYRGNERLLHERGTKVLMKNGKAIGKVKQQLKDSGLYARAGMVENCGLAEERVYHNLDDAGDDAHYFSVIVVKEETDESNR